ncbi:hypothetical protein PR202_ga18979 [Eleusine coracana subsp. coracana]|uniref:BTB domain-containing protein n=1 Tax=Eleusine coracana subsp. coracana TaxID=191504 RepID=A0AAV5CUE3_ELECO|nr:hypothetical protein PR202_ga18979 [Eleusine coracana subsp. coracana]
MCVLTVIKESPSSKAVTPTIAVPPENLQQDLAYMLKDGRCKDVTFSVDGQLFDAHRCVLAARSPVFEVELFGSSPNNQQFLGETSSTCRTESVVTVAHNFQVPDFALLEGMGIGKHVSSCAFSVGDCDWVLNGEVQVKIVDRDGTHQLWPAQQNSSFMLSETFQAVGQHCGINRFFPKPRLQQLLFRTGGSFIVRCLVTVVKESQSENDAVKAIVVQKPTISQDLARMLKEGEGTDVTFSVQGKLFPAHRCVLAARSPYFRADLFGPMRKKPAQGIHVDPAIFEALLHFIYTDSLPKKCNINDSVIAQKLLVAADHYGLERLRIVREDKLSRSMDVKTVVSTLVLADKHHCVQLKDACLGFMGSSLGVLDAIMKTQGFKDHVEGDATFMRQILDRVALAKPES